MENNLRIEQKTVYVTAVLDSRRDLETILLERYIASQGNTVEEARSNLQEALELFLECASETEIQERLHREVFITSLEVAVG